MEKMATRDGHKIASVLVKDHGWAWNLDMGDDYFGDIPLIDPQTGESMTPYQALDVQMGRTGATDSDSPLREIDPLKWSALRACEFIEAIPAEAVTNSSTSAEMWARFRHLAEYAKREGVV